MKVVILAGGFGTRISEESHLRPKPMIEIGEHPILWHIMKIYSSFGFNEFVICLGYKGYVIKEYFANYFLHNSDVTFDLSSNGIEIHNSAAESWKVTLVDTGLMTQTGGRLRKIRKYLSDETFLMTYGDGVADIDISELLYFHRSHGKYSTITAVQPPGRFGALAFDREEDVIVRDFQEKPQGDGSWINGGFFVLEPDIFQYIENDDVLWEKQPLFKLSSINQLVAYRHSGFWKPMDTLRDKNELESLWDKGAAPWKIW